jgi:hypothetical protein
MADDQNNPDSTSQTTENIRKSSRATRRAPSPIVAVQISETVIQNSVARDSSHCMIAEAIKEQRPEFTNVSVDLSTIRSSDPVKRLRYIYLTPRAAQIALIEFDRGTQPAPFAFTLRQAAQIVRGSMPRKEREPLSPEEKRQRKNAYQNKSNEIKKRIYASSNSDAHEPVVDEVQRVISALHNPDAQLGPAMAVWGPTATRGTHAVPVIVGGHAPPPGNLAKTRRFGLRVLRE